MNPGGDAAEQVVRLSLEGFEAAVRLTGAAAKDIALLLASVLGQQTKTKGRARLTSMIRSGHELKVFTVPGKDLEKFTEQARRYGVLYCVLREKSGDTPVDIIARADDASKIARIVERYGIGTVERASVTGGPSREAAEKPVPFSAKREAAPLSGQSSGPTERPEPGKSADPRDRPSVRQKLKEYEAAALRQKAPARQVPVYSPVQVPVRQTPAKAPARVPNGDLLKRALLQRGGAAR